MRNELGGIMLLLLLPLLAAAEAPLTPRDLGPTLRALADQYQLPGAVAAIVHGDRLVALGSIGVRKADQPAAFLPTDVIHLGSDTKAMTAMLIGQLIDRKKIRFDTPMRECFPDLATKMVPAMAGVTVRDLLRHNAGLPHDLDWWAIDRTHADLPAQRRLAVARALSAPPATPIGSYSYSNVSFVVLGAIIEAKTGRSWEETIGREIFDPLHMTTAGFGPPGTLGTVDQPWGHVIKGGRLVPTQIDNAPVLGPAGTVHCSIGDWSRFIAETLRAARGGGHPTLVSADTFEELTTPKAGQEYAGGWIVTRRGWAGGPALAHSGSNTTWYCDVWIAPKKDEAFLIALNLGSDPAARAADDGIGKLIEFNDRPAP